MNELIERDEYIPQERTLEVITAEILMLRDTATASIIGIGQRLIEAKELVEHGEWYDWLEQNFSMSTRTAQNYMALAEGYPKNETVSHLGMRKALKLLALDDVEREEFIAETHNVGGTEKTVDEMTVKELEKAIRERDAAKSELSDMENALAAAGQERELAEKEIDNLQKELEDAQGQVDMLQDELDRLKDNPPEVTAVETVVDHEAEEALKKQIETLKKEIAKGEKSLAEARDLIDQGDEAKETLQNDLKALQAKNEELKEALEAQRKKAAVAGGDVAVFKLHFEAAQKAVKDMQGIILGLQVSGDHDTAEKLINAFGAFKKMVEQAAVELED